MSSFIQVLSRITPSFELPKKLNSIYTFDKAETAQVAMIKTHLPSGFVVSRADAISDRGIPRMGEASFSGLRWRWVSVTPRLLRGLRMALR